MDRFAPLRESSTHDLSIVPSRQQMAPRTKKRSDCPESREKALGVPDRLETSHATFSFPRRLMRRLCAIVGSLVAYVLDCGQYLRLGGGIAAKFVGNYGSRHILQLPQQLAKGLLGSSSVAAWLHQNIQYLAVLIDGTPQILELAVDGEVDFIEVPTISRAR